MLRMDKDGQPENLGINFNKNQLKAINTLYGLCMGVVADGKVDDAEILFLDVWLKGHEEFLGSYPLNVIQGRVERILSDGVITSDERNDLHDMLVKLVGGAMEETGEAGGASTRLPADNVDSLVFSGAVFCFTGKFLYGQRKDCESKVISLGAVTAKSVTKKVTYLVIGELASRDWKASSHGLKIEKALDLKGKGSDIMILLESDWVKYI